MALAARRAVALQLQKAGARSVFTYPAPRKLSDIMKVPLVRKCEPLQVQEMWKEYHRERKDALADSIPAGQFDLLRERAKPCRLFLYPVFRESGYMTLVSQFQDSCFLLTFLDEYRQNPGAAKPWMSLTLYDEFVADKGLGLLRGDVGYQLTREGRGLAFTGRRAAETKQTLGRRFRVWLQSPSSTEPAWSEETKSPVGSDDDSYTPPITPPLLSQGAWGDFGGYSWLVRLSSSTFPSACTLMASPLFESDVPSKATAGGSPRSPGCAGDWDAAARREEKGEESGGAGPEARMRSGEGGLSPRELVLGRQGSGSSTSSAELSSGSEGEEEGEEGGVGSPRSSLSGGGRGQRRRRVRKELRFAETDRIVLIPARADYDAETKQQLWWELKDYEYFKQCTIDDYNRGIRDFSSVPDDWEEQVRGAEMARYSSQALSASPQASLECPATAVQAVVSSISPTPSAPETRSPSPAAPAQAPTQPCEGVGGGEEAGAGVVVKSSEPATTARAEEKDAAAPGGAKPQRLYSFLSHDAHSFRAQRDAAAAGDGGEGGGVRGVSPGPLMLHVEEEAGSPPVGCVGRSVTVPLSASEMRGLVGPCFASAPYSPVVEGLDLAPLAHSCAALGGSLRHASAAAALHVVFKASELEGLAAEGGLGDGVVSGPAPVTAR